MVNLCMITVTIFLFDVSMFMFSCVCVLRLLTPGSYEELVAASIVPGIIYTCISKNVNIMEKFFIFL